MQCEHPCIADQAPQFQRLGSENRDKNEDKGNMLIAQGPDDDTDESSIFSSAFSIPTTELWEIIIYSS